MKLFKWNLSLPRVLTLFLLLVGILTISTLYYIQANSAADKELALHKLICADNDAGQVNPSLTNGTIKAYDHEGNSVSFEDHCIDEDHNEVAESKVLIEYYCQAYGSAGRIHAQGRTVSCEYGCKDGKCLPKEESIVPSVTPEPTVTTDPTPTPTPFPTPYSYNFQESWKRITLDESTNISIAVPDVCEHIIQQGIDSIVGGFDCPDFSLSYDIGHYSNPLNNIENISKYDVDYKSIDGEVAKIIVPDNNEYLGPVEYPAEVGVHFDDLKYYRDEASNFEFKLTMYGEINTDTQQQVFLTMIDTLRFPVVGE